MKINPLYILLLLIVIYSISFIKLNGKKDELDTEYKNFTKFNQNVKELNELKKDWNKNGYTKKQIARFKSKYNSLNISYSKNKTIMSFKTLDNKLLQKFVNDILNDTLLIKKYKITKDSATFEIGEIK